MQTHVHDKYSPPMINNHCAAIAVQLVEFLNWGLLWFFPGMDLSTNGKFIMTCSNKNELILYDLRGDVLTKYLPSVIFWALICLAVNNVVEESIATCWA